MDAGPTAGMAVLISLLFATVFDQLPWSTSLGGIISQMGGIIHLWHNHQMAFNSGLKNQKDCVEWI